MKFYYAEYNPDTLSECAAVLMKAKTLMGAKREAGRIGTAGLRQGIGLSMDQKGHVAEYVSMRWNYKGDPWEDATESRAWAKMVTADMHIIPEKTTCPYDLGCYPYCDPLDGASFSPFRNGKTSGLLIGVAMTFYYQEKYGFFVKIRQCELGSEEGKWYFKHSMPDTEDHYFLGNPVNVNDQTKIKYGCYFDLHKKELLAMYIKDHHLENICPTPII